MPNRFPLGQQQQQQQHQQQQHLFIPEKNKRESNTLN